MVQDRDRYILGISAFYHDSAAALLRDGNIIAAIHEERFSRKKHDSSFPRQAVKYCLDHAGVSSKKLDAVVFYDKPLLKFERLLESYYACAPRGLKSFLKAMPVWIKEKVMLKRLIIDELDGLGIAKKHRKYELLFPEHHLSHGASAYYPSPFVDAAILTMDGVGEWATASIMHGVGKEIRQLRELRYPHSLGLFYSAFTNYLGFRVNSGEYKVMGLAPYGDEQTDEFRKFVKLIRDNIISIADDGSLLLNLDFFDYMAGLDTIRADKWKALFGMERRSSEGELNQSHCNMALAVQRVTEEVVLKMAEESKQLTGSNNLCMAGGVALNCVANGKIKRSGVFRNIWVQPAAGDAGGALGAAYAAHHIYYGQEKRAGTENDAMEGAYLGPEYSNLDIKRTVKKYDAVYKFYHDFDELSREVAKLLDMGHVVGWFQGRGEWGPRALGSRSILADARNEGMQKRLNLKIKYREGFRPFAPAVLAEYAGDYFSEEQASPYMLFVTEISEQKRIKMPVNKHKTFLDRLYFKRSDVPAITHLDYSARVQTVHRNTNERFWQLIKAFKDITGCSLLVNTSFNVRGEPIVNSPDDAYRCFMNTDMDYLVMENYLFSKVDQPNCSDRTLWRIKYKLD